MDYWHQIASWISDLLWPARCLGCGRLSTALCKSCSHRIPKRTHQECLLCKKPSRFGNPCTRCIPNAMLDRLLVGGHADHALLRQAIHALKYKFAEDLSDNLGDWLLGALAGQTALPDNPLFCPVPLHSSRLHERGFNQADLIGRRIARALAFEYDPLVLERVRATSSQVKTHSRWERIENMRGAFQCIGRVDGRNIILIDDVCTTGATLDACAGALKEAGAASVSAWVLARG